MKRQVPKTRHEELSLSFRKFNLENSHVYKAFKKWVFRLLKEGHSRLASGMILSLIRSDPTIRTSSGDKLGLNQNFSAFFAQKFLSDYPQHNKVFEVQKQPTKDRLPLKNESKSGSRKAKKKAVSMKIDTNTDSIKRSA